MGKKRDYENYIYSIIIAVIMINSKIKEYCIENIKVNLNFEIVIVVDVIK